MQFGYKCNHVNINLFTSICFIFSFSEYVFHNLITYIFYVSLTPAINILIHYAQIFLLYIAYGWMPEQLTESCSLKHIDVFMFIKVTSSHFQ